MKNKGTKYRSMVILIAYGGKNKIVEESKISYEDYYEESAKVIDDDKYRAKKKIIKVLGVIYNSKGKIQSKFENYYNKNGKYIRSRTEHEDGTVTEN